MSKSQEVKMEKMIEKFMKNNRIPRFSTVTFKEEDGTVTVDFFRKRVYKMWQGTTKQIIIDLEFLNGKMMSIYQQLDLI